MFRQNNNLSAQSGSALVYVFIGIALFAILAFTFSKSYNSSSTSTLTSGEAKIVATKMLQFSRNVHNGIQKLLLKGCSEFGMELNNPNGTGQNNPDAPPDGSCTLFGPNGAKVAYTNIAELGAKDNMNNDVWFSYNSDWFITTHVMGVSGVGPGATEHVDLMLYATNVNQQVCMEINKILGIPNPSNYPPRDSISDMGGDYYPQQYMVEAPAGRVVITDGGELYGKGEGCYVNNIVLGIDKFYYYKVLIAH